jgi:hypothetical protein
LQALLLVCVTHVMSRVPADVLASHSIHLHRLQIGYGVNPWDRTEIKVNFSEMS